MEQDSIPSKSRFLPAQLLQQKLLKYQRKEESKSMKKGNRNLKSSKSDTLLLDGKKSSVENALDTLKNEGTEEDDDNDVAIPGSCFEYFFFSFSNNM